MVEEVVSTIQKSKVSVFLCFFNLIWTSKPNKLKASITQCLRYTTLVNKKKRVKSILGNNPYE